MEKTGECLDGRMGRGLFAKDFYMFERMFGGLIKWFGQPMMGGMGYQGVNQAWNDIQEVAQSFRGPHDAYVGGIGLDWRPYVLKGLAGKGAL